jgi:hypothetical protein
VGSVANVNDYSQPKYQGLMREIVGGQRMSLYPYGGQQINQHESGETRPDFYGKIQDKWDFRLKRNEIDGAKKFFKEKYLHSHKDAVLAPNAANRYLGDLEGKTIKDSKTIEKSILNRLLMEHVIMKDPPWVSQRAYFHKLPLAENQPANTNSGYAMVPSTAAGELYPGKTVAVFDPATDRSKMLDAQATVPLLQEGKYKPAPFPTPAPQ